MIDVLINSMGSTLSQCVCYQITTLYTSNLTVLLVIYASIKLKEKKKLPQDLLYIPQNCVTQQHTQTSHYKGKQTSVGLRPFNFCPN